MKQILLIATGGTIASKYTKDGLSPAITAQELLTYIPAAGTFCRIETVQPFFLDSTNVGPDQWLILADLIEKKYDHYDGFVICHGTDTMAYTAAALSYLVQNSRKPIVITGARRSRLTWQSRMPGRIFWTVSGLSAMSVPAGSTLCLAVR